MKAQEDAYNAKTDELKRKSEGGGVAALRAKNELAQHLEEDPLPLRRAKITQEAAVKKADKAAQAAAAALEVAAKSRAEVSISSYHFTNHRPHRAFFRQKKLPDNWKWLLQKQSKSAMKRWSIYKRLRPVVLELGRFVWLCFSSVAY